MIKKTLKGFTLLEVLLVIAIIAILAGIVILALNPGRQLKEARNSQRWVDVNTILNGVYEYTVDNNGTVPTAVPSSATEICNTGIAAGTCTTSGLVNLSVITDSETYLTAIPEDPTGATTNGAGYTIEKSTNDRITVAAPDAELSETISVTR